MPPNEASFQVPLRWTKFDLRDYLWNLYNVEVRKVRSYVKEMPLTRRSGYMNLWYRPQAKKIMTVELCQAFQWPEVPENKEAWNKEMFDRRQEMQEKQTLDQKREQEQKGKLRSKLPLTHERKELAKLARQMLSGEVKWSNDVELDPKWDAILAEFQKPAVAESKEETKI